MATQRRRFIEVNEAGVVVSDRVSVASEEDWAEWDRVHPALPANTKDVTDYQEDAALNGYVFKSQTGKDAVFDPPPLVIVEVKETVEAKVDRLILAVEALTAAVNNSKP